ncbi:MULTISPECIES: bifunctional phosphopantothenoylcysteine decarboxylase/phosphopantothenate--cysteine ligase CoaBC [unclassified Actinomyces]|uniref:bifunctional phosphopantothenoylcysteine decarboxylase/phosphopantothenate--cysteine ligase CoaBC n=1 Tax=unclassified Actinomyces TaxID=2609248 RepID=UPI0013A6A9E2|nr:MULTISPECIES: bifunctional phosphopantothenoylcysteine decarboxylase/phosphopantothenate--cysteine ligase CoaBC [unclassified Actinomyces]MBW3070235.1 bifunctional phosphopantothenoylcysteine decarboxylase/phosphopantothenate--cysteine ligase CoaBC [Actinomyces sp. 594]NDR52697.1 bifunctional phosphopantothenoylcysteine decarboxylase/phosphopantothenate--cysteine ligase CoaBC [Actinomyces sp. 565]
MNAELPSARGARAPRALRVVVGISGSISAYKAPSVIRLLRAAGHEVRTVPTAAALRFIGAPALSAVTGSPVQAGVFEDPAAVAHVETGEWAELVVVAPASADLLARAAAGRADDLLTATLLTTTAPVVMAPAMHTQMWNHPATRENVATLRRRGVTVIDPDSGPLTGSGYGSGRLPAPEVIVSRALAVLDTAHTRAQPDLVGRHVVVSAGGTREPLDPVRYLGNRSSGRQGAAVACAAAARGARVTLVSAHVDSQVLAALPAQVEVVPVTTALELRDAVRAAAADADAVVMAAAVADFRPAAVAGAKLKKHPLAVSAAPEQEAAPSVPTIALVENPDVLAELVTDPPRRDGAPIVVVGFAAETGDAEGDVLDHGAAKARRKGADLLAVNAVGTHTGFGDVPNTVVVLDAAGREVGRASGSKQEVATVLMEMIAVRLGR